MGAVHGVHLKYAAASALCAYCARGATRRAYEESPPPSVYDWPPTPALAWAAFLWHAAAVHALITALFLLRRGQWLIGKRPDGRVPLWSHVVWAAFHAPTWLYTAVHTEIGVRLEGVPVASEVAPGWWIGGRYGARLGKKWAATIDLTVEFPEGCAGSTREYLNLPCWDGQPPAPRDIERAARFAAEACGSGDVMVHCAHGKGRSTCVMVACLVRAGLHATWRDAFEAVRPRRKGVKLNRKMRDALDEWQRAYARKGSA